MLGSQGFTGLAFAGSHPLAVNAASRAPIPAGDAILGRDLVETPLDRDIAAVRAFNRYYANQLGKPREGCRQSRFSPTEVRVLRELSQSNGDTAARIAAELSLDAGYLSRMLRRFEDEGLLTRGASATDRRRNLLTLTEAGHAALVPLEQRSRQDIGRMLAALPEEARVAMIAAMRTITRVMSAPASGNWTARTPAPGDIGWVISRHAALYAREFGFNQKFEARVAQIAGSFLADHDRTRERAWIAEKDGARVGSVFLVRKTDEIGQLRLLLIEPSARGLGIGRDLVQLCIDHAREVGYRRLTLWTNDILVSARNIYASAGFRLVTRVPHCDFGPAMVGEEWEMEL